MRKGIKRTAVFSISRVAFVKKSDIFLVDELTSRQVDELIDKRER